MNGTIGVSLLTLDNPFFKVIGDNITAEGRKHGYETIVVSGDKDVAKQGNQIKDFIVKNVSAGAGGAARAIAVELGLAGTKRISVVNRSEPHLRRRSPCFLRRFK